MQHLIYLNIHLHLVPEQAPYMAQGIRAGAWDGHSRACAYGSRHSLPSALTAGRLMSSRRLLVNWSPLESVPEKRAICGKASSSLPRDGTGFRSVSYEAL
jgi:hypothetical protein